MNVPIHIQVWHSKMVYIYSLCIQWCCIMMTTYILVMHISHESKKKGGPLHILHIMRGGRRNFFSPKILGLPPFFTWLPLYIYIHKGWLGCAPTYFIYLMKVVPWRLIHIFSHLMKVVQWRLIHIFHISWRWCNGGSYILFHISWRWCSGWGIHIFFFTFHEGVRIAGLEHTYLFTFHEGVPDCRIGAYIFFFTFHEAGSEVEMEAKVEAEACEGKWFTIQFCRVHPSVAMPYWCLHFFVRIICIYVHIHQSYMSLPEGLSKYIDIQVAKNISVTHVRVII